MVAMAVAKNTLFGSPMRRIKQLIWENQSQKEGNGDASDTTKK